MENQIERRWSEEGEWEMRDGREEIEEREDMDGDGIKKGER